MPSTVESKVPSNFFLYVFLLLFDCLNAFQITGATGGIEPDGQRPFRLEIRDLAASGAPFDLFILASQRLQKVDPSETLSYFQIAGIHGYPRRPWDNVIGNENPAGFCMHASAPFPAWHRPYIALYEQAIWQHAQDVALEYPEDSRDKYVAAATTLRHPYWDWAAYSDLPDVVAQPQLAINTPTGLQMVDNPLYEYVFQQNASSNGFPLMARMSYYPETVRYWNPSSGFSNQSEANATLQSNAPMIQSLVYQMFTSVSNYTVFSCAWPGAQWDTGISIESIHNSIHNSVGGKGHMAYPEFAGFDPIFWLHHASVDRLFAMWQALYPDSYITPTMNSYGSYFESPGSIDSGASALAPFHSDNNSTMFTSDDIRSIQAFGYSYAELPDWRMSQDQLAANVRMAVNRLYSPSSNHTVRRSSGEITGRSANIAKAFGYVSLDLAQRLQVNNLDRQWSITVLVDRFALDTSFCIDFFMGDAPNDVAAWPTAANLIGTYAQFGPANATTLHPRGLPPGQIRGEVSMTHTLAAGVSRGAIRDLSPRSVVPLLQKALNWKARTHAGEQVPVTSLAGLSVSVSTRKVVPRTAQDQFPQYGAVQWLDSVTEGKPCGAGRLHRQS